MNFFEANVLFTEAQFGFRSNKSTALAINELTDWASGTWERRFVTYASLFDLTKAFHFHRYFIQ